jgi:ribosome-associated protein
LPTKAKSTPTGLDARVGAIAGLIDEMKGEEIVVLDLRGLCDFTDAFVIATGRSSTHLSALAASLLEKLRAGGLRPLTAPDRASARWTLIDYGDVVVHLFDPEARAYYDLERLWGDAQLLPWTQMALA